MYHDSVKDLVFAEQALRRARAICATAGVIQEIDTAFNLISTVGDRMYPQIIQEARKNYQEAI